jgi:DNA repair photolyase
MNDYIKGRGAQINPSNPYEATVRDIHPLIRFDEDEEINIKTRVVETTAKTIVNKVLSPDVGLEYSLNPYQGCEHGCVYCYARNTHTYWGYSAGLDFETTILVKTNAQQLLEKKLRSRNWEAAPIMLSGNTDCYQPVEKKYGITRSLLQTFWDYKHPVGIVTKNALILRDLDLLKKLASCNLVSVAISINTLDDSIRQLMEPRASSIPKRLKLVKTLADAGIPVTVLAAPIIPGLTDQDILPLVKKVASLGARRIANIVVRLNGDIESIFTDWVKSNYPDRATKVLNKIKALHGGKVNDSRFGVRMRGEGVIAEIINQQFDVARRLYCIKGGRHEFDTTMYTGQKNPQLRLFA